MFILEYCRVSCETRDSGDDPRKLLCRDLNDGIVPLSTHRPREKRQPLSTSTIATSNDRHVIFLDTLLFAVRTNPTAATIILYTSYKISHCRCTNDPPPPFTSSMSSVSRSCDGKIVIVVDVQHRRVAIIVYSQLLERKVVVHDPVFFQGFVHRCRHESLQSQQRDKELLVAFRVMCEFGGVVSW